MELINSIKILLDAKKHQDFVNDFAIKEYNKYFDDGIKNKIDNNQYDGFDVMNEDEIIIYYTFGYKKECNCGSFIVKIN